MTDLNRFIKWSKNNPYCSVEIKVGGYEKEDAGKVKIWVYDTQLNTGQFVSSVEEINLEGVYREDMERKKREVDKYFQKQDVV
jgi:hypothetical protein